MAAFSTRNWTGETFTKTADGKWQADITWMVSGARSGPEACNASPLVGSTRIPNPENQDQHPEWSALVCESVTPERIAPETWQVHGHYVTKDESGGGIPVGEPLGFTWYDVTRSEYEEEIEVDALDRAIVNAVGDPFSPRLTRKRSEYVVTVRRYETEWNLSQALIFEDVVNLSPITIPRIGTVPKWCAKFDHIMPVESYTTSHKQIQVEYRFRVRKPMPSRFENKVGPFDTLVLNQGTRAWYRNPDGVFVPARIKDGAHFVTTDVRLTDGGAPMADGYTVGDLGADPIELGVSDGFIALSDAVYRIVTNFPTVDFGPITTIFR